jgi:hypothetical protein
MLVFVLVLTACPTSLGNDSVNGNGNGNGEDNGISDTDKTAVNKVSLESAITAAEAEKALVTVSADGSDIAGGKDWVIQEVMDAFTAAITAAKAVKDSAAATQADVDAALGALNAARTTFQNTKASGTKTLNFTMAELNELVTAVNSVKAGVVSSADGSDLSPSVQWVPTAIWDALNTALSTAEAITDASSQSDRDAAYTALNIAKKNFTAAKSNGTKAVALSGKTYFEHNKKIVFSVTSTSSGSYTYSQAINEGGSGYLLANGKFNYGVTSEIGTYTVNEGSSTVTCTPVEVRYYPESGPSLLVNEADSRNLTVSFLNDFITQYGQEALDEILTIQGFSSESEYINYTVSEAFAAKSMIYSFSGDGALFLDGSLPPNVAQNDLSGKTLTRISYSGIPQTVEFSVANTYTYTLKENGSSIESGAYSLPSVYTGIHGDKRVSLKPLLIGEKNRVDYYNSLSYGDPGYYEDIITRKAGETNRVFGIYKSAHYKLTGGNDGEISF